MREKNTGLDPVRIKPEPSKQKIGAVEGTFDRAIYAQIVTKFNLNLAQHSSVMQTIKDLLQAGESQEVIARNLENLGYRSR